MKPLTVESIRINPEILGVLQARARRARAAAVHSLLARLIHRFAPRVDLRPWGAHWG